MKNILCIIMLFALTLPLAVNAQETNTFTPPKAGDYSIGVDALPIINFLGNALNNTSEQELENIGGTPNSIDNALVTPNISIMGRYMLSRSLAVRANVGFIVKNNYTTAYTTDDLALAENSLSEAEVIDSKMTSESGASISVGLEYRIGKGRIQGVFSGSALYIISSEVSSYSYGNAVTSLNQSPSNASLASGISTPSEASYFSSLRPTSVRGGTTHTMGILGSAGIEWFLSNNISLGTEVNLVAAYSRKTQSYSEFEGYNTSTNKVETYTSTTTPSSSQLYIATDNISANISLNFYF